MPNKNLSLSPTTIGLLAKLGNASGYVESSISMRWPRVIQALEHLRARGWQSNEILAACDVLNGCWMFVHDPTWHGASMTDGQEYAVKWDISEKRWKELARVVSESAGVAFALDLVVSEFWTGNTYLERLIRGAE
jgi:hypothetical protein